jgi:hypothetical protein
MESAALCTQRVGSTQVFRVKSHVQTDRTRKQFNKMGERDGMVNQLDNIRSEIMRQRKLHNPGEERYTIV